MQICSPIFMSCRSQRRPAVRLLQINECQMFLKAPGHGLRRLGHGGAAMEIIPGAGDSNGAFPAAEAHSMPYKL